MARAGTSRKLTGTQSVQPYPDLAPVTMATLNVTRATPNGGRETYNIVRPMRDLIENLPDVLLKGVGAEAQFERNDPYDKLLLVILSASTPGTEEYAPTYDTTHFVENGCWYYASDAEVGKQGVLFELQIQIGVGEPTGTLMLQGNDVARRGLEFCSDLSAPCAVLESLSAQPGNRPPFLSARVASAISKILARMGLRGVATSA